MAPVLVLALATAMSGPAADTARPAARANNAFAADLYRQLSAGREGNLFVSPFSISTALAMTAAGAGGQTLEEMRGALHLPAGEAGHDAYAAWIGRLNRAGKPYQLNVANALWGSAEEPWREEFLDRTRRAYGAGLQTTDFSAPERARKRINAWVEDQTRGKVEELIPAGLIDPTTRMVLTNAVYFKGQWSAQFDPKLTRDAEFKAPGGPVRVAMMHREGLFGYHAGDDAQILETPYAGDDLAMTVILPGKSVALAEFEKSLTGDRLRELTDRLRPAPRVKVWLPRFRLSDEFELKEPLTALGMKSAFGPGADFSGMSAQGGLAMSAVVHKSFVEVNEEGAEAAAATGVIVSRGITGSVPEFKADRPFLFLIRDLRTGGVLFIGRVADPTKS